MTLKDYNTVQELVALAETLEDSYIKGSLLQSLQVASVDYFRQNREECIEVNIAPIEGLSPLQLEELVQL